VELTVDSFLAVAVLNGYALAAFSCGRLTVRAAHRAPRWVHFLAPPLLTAAAGYGVVWWLVWPSYYAAPFLLLWWGGGLVGTVTGWTCPGPRRGVRACLRAAWKSPDPRPANR
jgi:hypothetical protein